MQRSVDYLQVVLTLDDVGIYLDCLYLFEIYLVDVFSDNLYQLLVALELDVGYLNLVYFVDDANIVWCQHLCAVRPVSLVSVVFARIVACRYVHASLASQVSYGE